MADPFNPLAVPPEQPAWKRLLAFFEHPLFTLPVGILGGIVGMLLYAPILVICGACVILAFHRARVVAGRPALTVQLPSYLLLCTVLTICLYGLNLLIQRKLKNANVSISDMISSRVIGSISREGGYRREEKPQAVPAHIPPAPPRPVKPSTAEEIATEQQKNVYQNLKFGVALPPSINPRFSMFSVSNWGQTNIGKHQILCEINLMVLERNIVGNSAGVAKFSDAPLVASGGTQSDPCLSLWGFSPESTPICFDITIKFSYALETQPSVSKTKETRFVGFMREGVFGWSEQPIGQQGSYCSEAQKQRDIRHKEQNR